MKMCQLIKTIYYEILLVIIKFYYLVEARAFDYPGDIIAQTQENYGRIFSICTKLFINSIYPLSST